MVKISVDEATAFDMLSILSLKLKDERSTVNYNSMATEIIESIGLPLYKEVLESSEYNDLFCANKEVFELVDLLNSGSDLSAIFVHERNMRRYAAKKALQQKFFNSDLAERKI